MRDYLRVFLIGVLIAMVLGYTLLMGLEIMSKFLSVIISYQM
jgi:hypothetical protein